jgi:hypothetical protein
VAAARPYPTPGYFPAALAADASADRPVAGALRPQDLIPGTFTMLRENVPVPGNAPLARVALAGNNPGTVKAHAHQGWWSQADFKSMFTDEQHNLSTSAWMPKCEEVRKRHMYLIPEPRVDVHPRVRRIPVV